MDWSCISAIFQSDTQTAFVPLALRTKAEDVFGFLPSRSRQLTYTLVTSGSFNRCRPGRNAALCADSDVTARDDRVSLAPSSWRPSSLLVTGAAAAVSAR